MGTETWCIYGAPEQCLATCSGPALSTVCDFCTAGHSRQKFTTSASSGAHEDQVWHSSDCRNNNKKVSGKVIAYIVLSLNKNWKSDIGVKSARSKWRTDQLTLPLHTSRLKRHTNLSEPLPIPSCVSPSESGSAETSMANSDQLNVDPAVWFKV